MAHTLAWRAFKRTEDCACAFACLTYAGAVLHAWRVLPGDASFKLLWILAAPSIFLGLSFVMPLLIGPLRRLLVRYGWMSFKAGFGQSPTAPLSFEPGVEQATPHGHYKLIERDGGWELQMRLADRWGALYRFNLEPRVLPDYEVANWFTSTHPASRFTNNLIASLAPEGRRMNLLGRGLTTYFNDGRVEERAIGSAAELHGVLTGDFGMTLSREDAERAFAKTAPPETA